jgi:hypothetical protein
MGKGDGDQDEYGDEYGDYGDYGNENAFNPSMPSGQGFQPQIDPNMIS